MYIKFITSNLIEITNKQKNMTRKERASLLKPKQPKKYSETFYNYMQYAIAASEPNDKSFKQIISWGEFLWNIGVSEDFPEHPYSKEYTLLFPIFKATFHDQKLLIELQERKRRFFKNASFFVTIDNATLHDDGKMVITITARECYAQE